MRRFGWALALLLFSGCAQLPVPPAPPASASAAWTGKLGYRLEAAEGERAQAGSASFELLGGPEQGEFQLNSPLGTTLASARWSPQGLSLFDGQRSTVYPNLNALGAALGERLGGTAIPLAALFDWLQGQPWPQAAHEPQASGEFLQLGWRVERQGQRLRLRHQRLTLTLITS